MERAVMLAPNSGDVLFDLGRLFLAASRFADAEQVLRRAVHARRENPGPRLALAFALLKQQRQEEAILELQKLLNKFPSHAEAWFNLGNVHRTLARFADAARCFQRVTALQSENADAWINLSIVLAQAARLEEARAGLVAYLSRHPDHADARNNLGQVERAAGRPNEAVNQFDAVLTLDPAHEGARLNRAIALAESGRIADARAQAAIMLGQLPHHGGAHFLISALDLGEGAFKSGWQEYRWRPDRQQWLFEIGLPPEHPVPRQDELRGRTVQLRGEQGLGDVLFFLRFVPPLKNIAHRVILDIDPRVGALLANEPMFSAAGEERKDEDRLTLLLGDLPLVTSTEPLDPLALEPDPPRVNALKQVLGAFGPPPYVGLTWEAGTRWSLQRSPGMALYKRILPARLGSMLANLPGTIVSLQRAPQPDDIANLELAVGRPVLDLSRTNADLRDALALQNLLDEYVGVSNTNMHLRAALRRTARVLVTQPTEWRWMNEGRTSPWFPSCLLYRQGWDGSWDRAIEALASDLGTALAN
jgi:tetratricopeptide (TPR) repeat protein